MKKFELPKLNYTYDALEPFIDARTMEVHHSKHHQAYTDKFNAAIEGVPELEGKTAEEIITNLGQVPGKIRDSVRNNGGGYINHKFFWPLLKKNTSPEGEIADAIDRSFGSLDSFKKQFSEASAALFGSGWAWLVSNAGNLEIMQTQNQDSPLTQGKTPLLTVDVWEHAYYLKYQNRRPEYIEGFFNVINWGKVNEHLANAQK